ncbi:MAG: HAMP domain-containing histidine kinase [Proteobacteria bacterium]|nr:HAMP domain-containing histidine kinase [Pseudomonadota bacterium]MBU1716235.1 HAMP domain-containing histidine kinase [Pseudomonadota bacterium]
MKRFKILIVIFCLALAAPLSYFVIRTLHGLEQEEIAELNFFAQTLFDDMEEELTNLVIREENRSVEEYSPLALPELDADQGRATASSLVNPPPEKYILGYFQNSPDGSFQTPLPSADLTAKANDPAKTTDQLTELNRILTAAPAPINESREAKENISSEKIRPEKKQKLDLAGKYLAARPQTQKSSLGQEQKRYEEITPAQARNITGDQSSPTGLTTPYPEKKTESTTAGAMAPVPAGNKTNQDDTVLLDRHSTKDKEISLGRQVAESTRISSDSLLESSARLDGDTFSARRQKAAEWGSYPEEPSSLPPQAAQSAARKIKVEVAPLQSIPIDQEHIFIFRRIELNNQIYRQGFVITINPFLEYLRDSFFINQPMAGFTNLKLSVFSAEQETATLAGGITVPAPVFALTRTFPRPFSFLQATLSCQNIPRTTGRQTLLIMLGVLGSIMLLGLIAIYQSVRVVVDLSERKSGFVASVTHELKTPLTNIRMYIEMLEQGIAADHNREQEYYRILDSETSRLSRLINNVLEFSKLERHQRKIAPQQGDFASVIKEVTDIMTEKIRQDGFTLKIEKDAIAPFVYDHEVMVQILINLLENSIKFGREHQPKEISISLKEKRNKTEIAVSDTGPGIPEESLKKIFNDFYRVDNSLTRKTKGTGIGLALVKKFITAMGGTVKATNNKGPGCTITLSLPLS